MKLAVSNIAWPAGKDGEAASILSREGVSAIEIAPTKIWPEPLKVSPADLVAYRRHWEDLGLPIVAMQALLFGKPDLTLFSWPAKRLETRDYLSRIIELGQALGAGALVFGSPKNRLLSGNSTAQADAIAVEFFAEIGAYAHAHNVHFCIEPNPVEYGCDYITRAAQGVELVRHVAQPGFGLHLDAAGMTMSKDPVEEIFQSALPCWHHFHVSEPFLAPIGTAGVDHQRFATALHKVGYLHWVSIEMNRASSPTWQQELIESVRFVQSCYGSPHAFR
jgi:sugar phosphate isomerase/epimerase